MFLICFFVCLCLIAFREWHCRFRAFMFVFDRKRPNNIQQSRGSLCFDHSRRVSLFSLDSLSCCFSMKKNLLFSRPKTPSSGQIPPSGNISNISTKKVRQSLHCSSALEQPIKRLLVVAVVHGRGSITPDRDGRFGSVCARLARGG